MEHKEEEIKDFDIIVGDGSELTNADIPVRWCISKELMAKLKSDEIDHPHILFVTIDDRNREMGRQVFPLEDLMSYVRFERPGVNKLFAFIIDNKMMKNGKIAIASTKQLKKMWCWKEGQYNYNVSIFSEGVAEYIEYSWMGSAKYIINECMTEVDIPKELFAKEPPLWFLNIVNMWHDTVVQDQCHFRQRVLLTVFFKGWIIGAGALLGSSINLLSALLMSGLGFRNTDWKPVIHPYSYILWKDVWEDANINDNYMYIQYKWDEYNQYAMSILLSPFFVVFVFSILYFLTSSGFFLSIWDTFKFLVLTFAAITGGIIVVSYFEKFFKWAFKGKGRDSNWLNIHISITSLLDFIFAPIIKLVDKFDDYLATKEKQAVQEMYNAEEAIYCPKKADNLVASIYALPEKKRTVKLRVLEIKNKICKPMPKV